MKKSAIQWQIFSDTLAAQLSGTLHTWIKPWRFTNEGTVLAYGDDKATESCLLSRPPSVKTGPIHVIRNRERSLPLIYPLLLAASAMALIMILLSDHFILT